MRNKNPLRFVVLIFLIAVIGFFVYRYLTIDNLGAVNPDDTKVQAFVVNKGETTLEVAQGLEKQGLIKSVQSFIDLVKKEGKDGSIKAGTYKLSPSMNAPEVLKNLELGVVDNWVTLLEGLRVEEYADKLKNQLGIDKAAFLKVAKEGYMFPDTYLFNKDATAETIAGTLRDTFDRRFNEDLKSKMKAKGLTPEQGVIMASIIEREARSDQRRTEVAGILLKRLKIGMALNADATVHYAKDSQELKQKGKIAKYWTPITQADYQDVVSPYNTYLHSGLPPAPICNPSLSSLKAVANADPSTPYLYYYHDPRGNTYYATTLEEHNRNVSNNR